MQTHFDSDSRDFMNRLRQRADAALSGRKSEITGGNPDEQSLAEWDSNGVGVRQLPPDEQGILRISIGGGNTPVPLNYCVFRGNHSACVDLLRKALKALESGPAERN